MPEPIDPAPTASSVDITVKTAAGDDYCYVTY